MRSFFYITNTFTRYRANITPGLISVKKKLRTHLGLIQQSQKNKNKIHKEYFYCQLLDHQSTAAVRGHIDDLTLKNLLMI